MNVTGYQLTKAFYAKLEQTEEMQTYAKSHHLSLYTWICELRNRTSMEVLDLPREYTMRMALIGSPTTLKNCIDDLAKWEIIEIIASGRNSWTGATKVKLACSFLNSYCTASEQLPNSRRTATEHNKNSITNKTSKTDNGVPIDFSVSSTAVQLDKAGKMIRPTLELLTKYILTLDGGTRAMAEEMYDHYGSNGWKVGKVPMTNWNRAASKWVRKNRSGGLFAQHSSGPESPIPRGTYV
jgi:hypothetical protein